MSMTLDHRTTLLASAPLLAGVDADGLASIAGRFVEVVIRTRSGHRPAGGRRDRVLHRRPVAASASSETARRSRPSGPGEFFGELSVLDGMPRTAQVIAAEPTMCLALATWDFEAVVRERPEVALAVMRGLAARLRGLTEAHRH